MTHQYDGTKTDRYFTEQAKLYDLYKSDAGACYRDTILYEKILANISDSNLTIIDYGCGAGGLLTILLEKGYNVFGIEPNSTLRQAAIEKLLSLGYAEDKVKLGGIKQLSAIKNGSIDMFVAMGVFQYLSDEEYQCILQEIHRILKANGHMVCTFQNGFFDLFTFNKYTIDFIEHQLLSPLKQFGLNIEKAISLLRKLFAHPDLPHYDESRARDNIFVRLSNPLTIKEELARFGFNLENMYFYTLHPVPPLIASDLCDDIKKISEKLEIEKSQEWYAYFMGNAFLTHCRPI